MNERPTKKETLQYRSDDLPSNTITYEDINSVEIVQDAKGIPRISKVKVYDSDESRCAERAVALYLEAKALLQQKLEESLLAIEEKDGEDDGS